MATYYPKTSLSIRTKDNNENTKTFSVGYVNPESTDGTLKEFALKVVDLSNLALTEVYKTTQDNITNATTDTVVSSGWVLASSSPFFSDDSDTFTAAITALSIPDSGAGGITFTIGKSIGGSTSRSVNLALSQIKKLKNLSGLIDALNHAAYDSITASKGMEFEGGIRKVTFDTEKVTDSDYALLAINLNDNQTDAAKNFVKSIGENLVQVSGYTAVYEQMPNFEGIMRIYITKN